MCDLLKCPFAFCQNATPDLGSAGRRYPELLDEQSDHRFNGHPPSGKVGALQQAPVGHDRLCERAPHLKMRGRMRVPWFAAVVVAKDPAVAVWIKLILVRGLLHLYPMAAVVGLSEENDEHAQVPPVPQVHRALVLRQPPFDHHPLVRAQTSSHAGANTIENCESKEEVDKVAKGSKRVGASCKGLLG